MKKTFGKSLSWLLSVAMIFGVFVVPSVSVSATQSKKENFSKNYTTVSGNPGQTVANIAYAQVGKSGSALGYTEDWCADFVADCADLAGQSAAVPRHGRADYIDEYILNAGGCKVSASNAKPGDIAFYDFNSNNSPDHVEVVYSVSGSTVKTIGGNTGNSNLYYATVCSPRTPGYLLYIIRPNYSGVVNQTPTPGSNNPYSEPTRNLSLQSPYCTGDDVKWVQWCLVKLGYSLDIDGIYGNDTHTQVANFQRDNGLTVDGICGAGTRSKLKEKVNGTHTHSYSVSSRTEPTCTQKGSVTYKCSCGASYSETLNALGHSYTTKTVAATCTAQGYTLHTCSRCGNNYKDAYTNSLGHSYTTKVVAPTYTEQGYTLHTCSRCGNNYKDSYTNKLQYVISYNMNGGSGSIANQLKNHGQNITLSSTKPTRTGYDFIGWNTNSGATTATYQPSQNYSANANLPLYAIWKAKQVTVTFYRNQDGNDNTTTTQTFTYGVNGQSFSNKNWSRNGYTLLGWSENRSATDKQYSTNSSVDPNWIIQKSPKVNLYAVWKANTYTIAYNANGGTGTMNSSTIQYGQTFTVPDCKFAKSGYNFTGYNLYRTSDNKWYIKDGLWLTESEIKNGNYTKKFYAVNTVLPFDYTWVNGSTSQNDTFTFYPIWQINTYTVSYNMNGGNGSIASQTKTYGQDLTLSWYIPTRTDYKFIGWNTDKNATTAQYKAGSNYTANSSAVLYAIWEKIDYNASPAAKGNFNGNTYEYYTQTLNWNQAYRFCEKKGGHLVTVTSKEENDFIVELTKSRSGDLWAGGKTSDHKTWYWITGEPFNYQNWETGEPNNLDNAQDTLHIYVSGKWDDVGSALSTVREFVCEYDGNIDAAKYTPAYTEQYNDHEYYFFADSVDWQTAKKICEAKGGYLAIPNNAEENVFIISGIKNTSKEETWIGITDIVQEGVWKDVKGNSLAYTNWASGQPDNSQDIEDYGHLYSGGQWNDGRGYGSMYRSIGFVCEFDSLCTASGHDYKLTSTKAATCTTDGEKIYTCSRCGDTKTETIKATGHSYTTKVVAPTCTTKGYTLHTCSKCGDSYKDTYTNATGHKYEETIVAPTPTEQGYTLHTCSVCKHSYKDNYTNILLSNNSTLSAETIKLGETITATAKAIGGTGEYLYQVVYKKTSDSKWTTAQAYKANAAVSIKPANATTYDICVKVKDSKGTEVKKFFTVKVIDVLKNNSAVSKTEINLGDTITVSGKAAGGTGGYTYAVYYKKVSDNKWTTAQSYKNNATVSIKPASATDYSICVKVKDSNGTEVKKYITVKVTNALKNNSTISKTEITLGDTVTVNGKATGGTDNYTYAVYYKKTSDSKWTTKQSYKANTTVSIKPDSAAEYSICIKVKDSSGTEVKKYITVKVSKPVSTLNNTSTISSAKIKSGERITVSGSATGGTSFYQYAFYYKKSTDTKWTTKQAYNSNFRVSIQFEKAATYDICVKVKDSDGSESKKYFTVTVTDSKLVNTSVLLSDSVKLNENVYVFASAKGTTDFYQYAVYIKPENSTSWQTVQSYGSNAVVQLKPTKTGTYDVCVKAKDNLGEETKIYLKLNVK